MRAANSTRFAHARSINRKRSREATRAGNSRPRTASVALRPRPQWATLRRDPQRCRPAPGRSARASPRRCRRCRAAPKIRGRCRAISARVLSCRITNAGTDCALDSVNRHALRRSSKAPSALERPASETFERSERLGGRARATVRRIETVCVPLSTGRLASVRLSAPCASWSTRANPRATSCLNTPRHAASSMSSPMPKTESLSWSQRVMRSLSLPRSTSISALRRSAGPCDRSSTAPSAPRWWHRRFRGSEAVSQLPHGVLDSPKYPSRRTRRHPAVSQRPSRASSLAGQTRLYSSLASDRSIKRAAARRRQGRSHPCIGRRAIASGASGFLVIAFDTLRQIEVRHEADIGLVDAHAEGDGRHHDHAFLALETRLVACARRRPCRRDKAELECLRGQPSGGFVDLARDRQ